jgi:hypothetical protein
MAVFCGSSTRSARSGISPPEACSGRACPLTASASPFFETEADGLSLAVVDRAGKRRVLTSGWVDGWNLAWAPDGREVWFGASRGGSAAALYAVDLEGRLRDVLNAPGTLEIHDIAKDGRALVARVAVRNQAYGRRAGDAERKLSWLESTAVSDVSADGRFVLLREFSERETRHSGVFLRDMQGAPPVRLGAGIAQARLVRRVWCRVRRHHTGRDVLRLSLHAVPVGPVPGRRLALTAAVGSRHAMRDPGSST